MEVIVERCAFLDVHRDTVMACARTPDGHGGRREEVSQFGSTTSQLLALADWLVERQVTLVGMEATGVYWKPVVRHEALFDRGGVKGLSLWAVAAAC
jgi:hypothetical protein